MGLTVQLFRNMAKASVHAGTCDVCTNGVFSLPYQHGLLNLLACLDVVTLAAATARAATAAGRTVVERWQHAATARLVGGASAATTRVVLMKLLRMAKACY